MPGPMALLELGGIHKSYPDGWTLTDVSFTVEEGEIRGLLGPFGCGCAFPMAERRASYPARYCRQGSDGTLASVAYGPAAKSSQ